MEKIKVFIEAFASAEAETDTLINKIDLNPYNNSLPKFYSFFIDRLNNALGKMKKEAWDEDDLLFMGDIESRPPKNPRQLFKISEYSHQKYGDVFVAYISQPNPETDFKVLTDAFFIINEGDTLKTARIYSYSNYESDGKKYQWSADRGYEDLTFESLTGPNRTERYQEPTDKLDSMKNYLDNI